MKKRHSKIHLTATVHTVLMISTFSGYEPESDGCAGTHTPHTLTQTHTDAP